VHLNAHRTELAKPALNNIADKLHLERTEIVEVLARWKSSDLTKHLSSLPEDVLRERGHTRD
jgi:hypothetical protein